MRHRTLALPLLLVYTGLIVYASLYPFSEWRDQGLLPLSFLLAPLPRYWLAFDVAANVLGYLPLGALLVLTALRMWPSRGSRVRTVVVATLLASGLSLLMETLQSYLPARVPSNVDWVLNTLGAGAGAAVVALLEPLGAIERWARFRQQWFISDSGGALLLLALWPVGLLFPAAVPLSLGQVFERAEAALADALEDTPFLEWLPVRDVELQPLVPAAELACVALGLAVPALIAYSAIRPVGRRVVALCVLAAVGIGVSALSAAMSYGPAHLWSWISLPVEVGLCAGGLLALVLCVLPRRGATALALFGLGIHLMLINQAPTSAYFAQTLQTWEQGRFIRFHGMAQWVGWLWPYGALAYLMVRVSRRDAS